MFYSNSIKSGKTLYSSKNGGFTQTNAAPGMPGGALAGNQMAGVPQH
jgi:hypothetical protein